jgi:hypothetical protein
MANDLGTPPIVPGDGKDEAPSGPPEETYFTGLKEAWPSFLTAMMFLIVGVWQFPLPGCPRSFLVAVMKVEFLVIHAGAILTALGIAKQTEEGKWKRILTYAFWAILGLYILVSFSFGWFGPLIFLFATAATFWGVGRGKLAPGFMLVLLIRWFVIVILFVIAIEIQHLPRVVERWSDEGSTHMAGFLYFTALSAFEWTGFFRAPWWRKIETSPPEGRHHGD